MQLGLIVALGIIMFGLGLSLTGADFLRIGKHPKVVLIALACQVVLLPALCFGLVLAFQLPPHLAIGMMLLAASPGGTTAKLYSHIFRGDVALNVSLTALTSVISVVTLPIITNLAFAYFLPHSIAVGLPWSKVAAVFAIVLVPVAFGMLIRWWKPRYARAADGPVRIASIVIVVVAIAGTVYSNSEILVANFEPLAAITALFCLGSLSVGYWSARLTGVVHTQVIASTFEIGIHNATLVIVIAQSLLGDIQFSLPAAVYSVLMLFVAAGFGLLLARRRSSEHKESEPIG